MEEKEEVEKPKEEKNFKPNCLLQIILLIWILISAGLIIYFFKRELGYSFIVFGQLMFICGLFTLTDAIKRKKKDDIVGTLCISILGLLFIVIPILIMNPNIIKIKLNWNLIIVFLLLSGFLIAGIHIIVSSIMYYKRLNKFCTISVPAKIIGQEVIYGERYVYYLPVFSFIFNKKEYKVCGNAIFPKKDIIIGKGIELKINPNNPDECYSSNKFPLSRVIAGSACIGLAVVSLICLVRSF